MTPDDTKPITKAECDPRCEGCLALAKAKASAIEERTELLKQLAEKVDSKAYIKDVKEIIVEISSTKMWVIATLSTFIGVLLGIIGKLLIEMLSK